MSNKNICKFCKEDENLHSFPRKDCPGIRGTVFTPFSGLVYQEHGLDEVIRYFAKDFNPKPETVEFFVDQQKGKVIFKLFMD